MPSKHIKSEAKHSSGEFVSQPGSLKPSDDFPEEIPGRRILPSTTIEQFAAHSAAERIIKGKEEPAESNSPEDPEIDETD
jgi:hypothetical protein